MNLNVDQIIFTEQTILGAIIKDNSQFDTVTAIIGLDDFTHPLHKEIFTAMQTLREVGKPIDFFMLGDILKPNYDDVSMWNYGKELMESVPVPKHAAEYAKSLRVYTKRKMLDSLLSKGSQLNVSGKPLDDVIDNVRTELLALGSEDAANRSVSLQDGLSQFFDDIAAALDGNAPLKLNTHFPQLDNLLQGMRPGNLIIIAGRPSSGKTTFALNIVRNILLYQKKAVQLFSFEMSQSEIVRSLLAMTGSIPLAHLKDDNITDGSMLKARYAVQQLKDAQINMCFTGATIGNVKKECKAAKERNPDLGLIVIDYLQLMSKPKSESRVMEITAITRELKLLAQELQVPMIALSQLNRNSDNGTIVREPRLSDLRDSGSIEQDADVVMFVHRDLKETNAKIMVAKNRSGIVSDISLIFDGSTATFKDFSYARNS